MKGNFQFINLRNITSRFMFPTILKHMPIGFYGIFVDFRRKQADSSGSFKSKPDSSDACK